MLFACTVLLFSRGLSYDFSNYDDPAFVTNNVHVQAGFTKESLAWAFTGQADYWHPLTWLSHMLDWQLWRDNAGGHHLTSVLWHALNAVLAFLVLRRLTGAPWTSAFAAALFAWHPLRVESVVWITERKDVMSGCFFLLTLWAFAAYAQRRDAHSGRSLRPSQTDPHAVPAEAHLGAPSIPSAPARPWPFYLLTLGLFLAGLMCKPMLVTLPGVLFLLNVWPLRRLDLSVLDRAMWRRTGQLLLEQVPLLALSLAIATVTVLMQQTQGAFVLDLPFGARLGNAVVSIARYLGKFLWPANLTVCYPHPGHWPWLVIMGATALVVVVTAVAWWQRRARPWVLVGWAGFLVALLPALGLIQVGFQAMADRYTYAPILLLQLALLWTLAPLLAARPFARKTAAVTAVAVLLGGAIRTWEQQAVWRDPTTLFRHALAVTERNEVGHALLAYTLATQSELEEAAIHSRRALELNPRNRTALFTLASVLERQGHAGDAAELYRRVLELNPKDSDTEYRLGLLLLRQRDPGAQQHLHAVGQRHPELVQQRIAEGMDHTLHGRAHLGLAQFEVALALNPDEPAAHFGAGLALAQLDRDDDAITAHRNALRLRADYPEAHTELGLLLLSRGEPAEAETHFRAALRSAPELATAHLGLARAAEQLGRADEATASFTRAVELAPDSPLVQRTAAQAFARRQQFAAAVEHYQRAIELQPQDAALRAELGYALILSGRRADGIAAWKAALALDPTLPGLRERLDRLERTEAR